MEKNQRTPIRASMRICLFAGALVCASAGALAQDVEPAAPGIEPLVETRHMDIKPDFGLAKLGLFSLQLYGGLKGIEIIPGAQSRALLYAGGGYVGDAYYRDLLTDNVLVAQSVGKNQFPDSGFKRWFAQGKIGLDLGILYNEDLEKNMLYSMIFVKTMYTKFMPGSTSANSPILYETDYPDRTGFFETSLYTGLYLDLVRYNTTIQTAHGVAGEVSLDWTPGLGLNKILGSAEYLRMNLTARGFYTFLESDKFGLYLAERVIADVLLGNEASISAFARRNIGALDVFGGAGGTVRGMEEGRYDSFVKLVNNLDLRFTMLPLFGSIVVPELFAFFDAGFVDNFDYAVNFTDGLYSTGAGLFINLSLGGATLFDIGYYVSYSITEKRLNLFNLSFSHHF